MAVEPGNSGSATVVAPRIAAAPSTAHEPAPRSVIARSAAWRAAEVIGGEALSFLVMLALARILVPADFGVVAAATFFVNVVQMLLYRGLAEAVVQAAELDERQIDAAFWVNLLLGLGLMVLLAGSARPVASLMGEPRLAPVLAALSLTGPLFAAIGIYQAVLRRKLAFRSLAIRTIAAVAAGGIVGVGMALAGAGEWSLVGQQLAYTVTTLIVLMVASRWSPRWHLSYTTVRGMARIGAPTTATAVGDQLGQSGLMAIAAIFLPSAQVGLLFLARRLTASIALFTFWSIGELSLPLLSRLQNDRERYREAAHASLRVAAVLCLPTFVGLALVARPLVETLFGPHWLDCAPVLQVLAVATLLQGAPVVASSIFTGMGAPVHGLVNSLRANVLLLVLVASLASFGVVAASIGAALAAAIMVPLVVRRLLRVVDLDGARLLREQAPIWGATIVMAAAVAIAGALVEPAAQAPLRLAAMVAVGSIAFVLALALLAPDVARWVGGTVSTLIRRSEP